MDCGCSRVWDLVTVFKVREPKLCSVPVLIGSTLTSISFSVTKIYLVHLTGDIKGCVQGFCDAVILNALSLLDAFLKLSKHCAMLCAKHFNHVHFNHGPLLVAQSYGPQPTRLLCSWDSPGKNPAVGCCFLPQGIFLTQGLNPRLLHLLYWQAASLPGAPPGKPNHCAG